MRYRRVTQGGALVTRQVRFDRLWPGGREIGDTALTQLIWRLRRAWFRGRRDQGGTARRCSPRCRRAHRSFAHRPPARAAARAGTAGRLAAGGTRRDAAPRAHRADTADLQSKAFAAGHASDSGRARQLMLQAAELDTQSPVAPALLAAHGFGDPDQVKKWAAVAQSRLRDSTPPYARLLVQLAQVSKSNDIAARQIEDAMRFGDADGGSAVSEQPAPGGVCRDRSPFWRNV